MVHMGYQQSRTQVIREPLQEVEQDHRVYPSRDGHHHQVVLSKKAALPEVPLKLFKYVLRHVSSADRHGRHAYHRSAA